MLLESFGLDFYQIEKYKVTINLSNLEDYQESYYQFVYLHYTANENWDTSGVEKKIKYVKQRSYFDFVMNNMATINHQMYYEIQVGDSLNEVQEKILSEFRDLEAVLTRYHYIYISDNENPPSSIEDNDYFVINLSQLDDVVELNDFVQREFGLRQLHIRSFSVLFDNLSDQWWIPDGVHKIMFLNQLRNPEIDSREIVDFIINVCDYLNNYRVVKINDLYSES